MSATMLSSTHTHHVIGLLSGVCARGTRVRTLNEGGQVQQSSNQYDCLDRRCKLWVSRHCHHCTISEVLSRP